MKRMGKCAAAAVVVLVSAAMAGAQEAAWNFKVTPYLWAMGIDGDITKGAVTEHVDLPFSEAVQDMDFAFMLAGEANNGKWSVLCDLSYINVAGDEGTTTGSLGFEFENYLLEGGVVYRAFEAEKTLSVDVGVGARGTMLDVDLNPSNVGNDVSKTKDWIDPVLIARVRQQFGEKLFAQLYADVGGFGVSSDLTWQLLAAGGFAFTDSISGLVGYRYLSYDYEKDDFAFDAVMHGVVTGVAFAF